MIRKGSLFQWGNTGLKPSCISKNWATGHALRTPDVLYRSAPLPALRVGSEDGVRDSGEDWGTHTGLKPEPTAGNRGREEARGTRETAGTPGLERQVCGHPVSYLGRASPAPGPPPSLGPEKTRPAPGGGAPRRRGRRRRGRRGSTGRWETSRAASASAASHSGFPSATATREPGGRRSRTQRPGSGHFRCRPKPGRSDSPESASPPLKPRPGAAPASPPRPRARPAQAPPSAPPKPPRGLFRPALRRPGTFTRFSLVPCWPRSLELGVGRPRLPASCSLTSEVYPRPLSTLSSSLRI